MKPAALVRSAVLAGIALTLAACATTEPMERAGPENWTRPLANAGQTEMDWKQCGMAVDDVDVSAMGSSEKLTESMFYRCMVSMGYEPVAPAEEPAQ